MPFQLLVLDGSGLDADPVAGLLTEGGLPCQFTRVETRDDFIAALESTSFDLILADYTRLAFDGPAALAIAREMRPEVPLILVSDQPGEQLAVEALQSGATDYVALKHQRMRLVAAVRRGLREAEERRERKRVEEALRNSEQRAARALQTSEARYRRLFETAKDGILILDADTGHITDVNPFLIEMLGYSYEELVGKELWEIGPFRNSEASRGAFRQLQEKEYIRYEHLPLETRDRQRREVEFVSNVYWVGNQKVIQCNIRDITERKRAEDAVRRLHDDLEHRVQDRTNELVTANTALQAEVAERERAEQALEHSRAELRNLASHLQLTREEDRTRIGREIHDELGQVLTALQMDLFWLSTRLTGRQQALRDKVGTMSRLLDATLEAVQRIVTELRPVILELGLTAAIEWEIEGFQERTGIACERDIDPEESGVNPACALALFRILQESLTNVARHANASRVRVGWKPTADQLILEVHDNGIGVTDAQLSHARSLGLLGMRERALAWGGNVTIHGAAGTGTVVTACIPVPAGAE